MNSIKTISRLALLAAMSITALSANAAGCSLTILRSDAISKAMNISGGFTNSNFETKCRNVNRAGAQVQIYGQAVVLGGSSIGYAILTLVDRKLSITTNGFASFSTQHNRDASQDTADKLMADAINVAFQEWDIDGAIANLDLERDKVRKAFSK